ncbi:ABC transporter ATP-binding protein [Halarcobacter mediterraneus]|uniref:ABC transporter ATP-binding protein n=1 Tax=Halarcobacter mediterraneus TaxID=2023153 RepID=A0A4Q1AWB4_9BACT|nr:ATP-binding cassette domain-containing protein [Halarcobacter mediterraneus]RXK11768.1 ABC transporter ATP-binding protein [Halarcobacter mediterraneus]
MSKAVDIKKLLIKSDDTKLVDISFSIKDSTALIGQSGSGKSLTLKAILNLLPSSLSCEKKISSNFDLNSKTIGFIPQNPFTSLSPMTKIKDQFFCKDKRKEELLKLVGLETSLLNRFPKELSGGQLQRVVIAIALSNDTKLLLLDEPTTALDETSKETILNLIEDISKKLNLLILFVTHDIESIRNLCKELIIIKDGHILEQGLTKEILTKPKEEYTKKLINSTFKNKEFRK